MRAKFALASVQKNNTRSNLRGSTILALGLFLAVGAVMGGPLSTATAAPSSPAVNQCNGTDNVGGQAVVCDITITNNLNLATGAVSPTVTTNDCHGAAGAPPAVTCIPLTQAFPTLTTSATQCNGSGNGGGNTVTCTVSIRNTILAGSTPAPRLPVVSG